MSVDADAARRFMAGHARLLDRRRFELLLGHVDADAVLAALDAYRNADGGYGWGLEPDLRSAGSQPISALHAFEVFEDCGGRTPRAVELCDWLAGVTCGDGGLPFVLPIDDTAACAPWFATAEVTTSSLHGTSAVASAAWRLARHDPAVASHPWLARATQYCIDAIARAESLHAYETKFALCLLDAVHDVHDEAPGLLEQVAATVSPDGTLAVEGGVEGEQLHPLDWAPVPDAPVRAHVAPDIVEADLERVAGGQQDDGGWTVDFASFSPAAALEWRGEATIRAVRLLTANGRLW